MKRGTIGHWKTDLLAATLQIPKAQAVGHLEALWHFTAQYRPAGDVGTVPDSALARQCLWDGDPEVFVEALIHCGWLERHPAHRLLVHDWHEHADDGTQAGLARKIIRFANGRMPSLTRIPKEERPAILAAYAQSEANSAPSEPEALPCVSETHGSAPETLSHGLSLSHGLAKPPPLPQQGLDSQPARMREAPQGAGEGVVPNSKAGIGDVLFNYFGRLAKSREVEDVLSTIEQHARCGHRVTSEELQQAATIGRQEIARRHGENPRLIDAFLDALANIVRPPELEPEEETEDERLYRECLEREAAYARELLSPSARVPRTPVPYTDLMH